MSNVHLLTLLEEELHQGGGEEVKGGGGGGGLSATPRWVSPSTGSVEVGLSAKPT